jgi:TetR/AcrR family transcriptional regulator
VNLFPEVLRRKIAERQTWGMATPDDPAESLPYWFELACKDPEWIRLLEWEALQFGEAELIDQAKRRESTSHAVERVHKRQMGGHLSADLPAPQLLLAMVALTWFPLAFPQLTRLITGKSAADEQFRSEQRDFLRQFAAAMRPHGPTPNGSPRSRRIAPNKRDIA